MRRRVWVVALALVVAPAGHAMAAAHGTAASTAHGSGLLIAGDRTATMTVTLRSGLTATPWSIDAVTKGTYAGYLLSTRHGQPVYGALWIKGVSSSARDAVPLAGEAGGVRPGRYVLTLITDGLTVIHVPTQDGARIVAIPRSRIRSYAAFIHPDQLPPAPAGSPVAYGSVPVPSGRHQLALLAAHVDSEVSEADDGDLCFTTGSLCQVGGSSGAGFTTLSPGAAGGEMTAGSIGYNDELPPGTRAVVDGVDAGIGVTHNAVVLVVG